MSEMQVVYKHDIEVDAALTRIERELDWIRRRLAASRVTEVSDPKIRPIAWQRDEPDEDWWTANTVVGPFEVRVTSRGQVRTKMPHETWTDFEGSVEQAKQRAQGRHDALIRSTLEGG